MKRYTMMRKRRLFVRLCTLTAAMLLVLSFSSRTVHAANGQASPEAHETPAVPTDSPDVVIIEISVVTPTPALPIVVPTDTPVPSFTPAPTATLDPTLTSSPTIAPEQTPTPEQTADPAPTDTPSPTAAPSPTPTPSPDPKEVALREAKDGLSAYRRPNRMRYTEVDEILETLPADLDLSRTLIVVKAYSLLGKVAYQFGGKSSEMGWDAVWNTVASAEATTNGAAGAKQCGLDCSGYVRWCFINAAGTSEMGKRFGSGTYKQWINSKGIPLAEAMPGDLVFVNEVGRTNHDGIVVQNNGNGTIMVLHSTIGKGVVLESAAEGGFKYARRPIILSGKNLPTFEASALRHRNEAFMADLRYLLAIREW